MRLRLFRVAKFAFKTFVVDVLAVLQTCMSGAMFFLFAFVLLR